MNNAAPQETTIIGFADDQAVVTVAKYSEIETISVVKVWLVIVQLDLAAKRKKTVLIKNHWKRNTISIGVEGHTITSKRVIKSMGVLFLAKVNMKNT